MRAPSLGRVRVGGQRVPYLELGDRAGPPVVLLPGLSDGLAPVTRPATRAMYAEVPVPLAGVRGLVVSHGARGDAALSTRQLARELGAVLDHLLEGPAVVVGHSMGGMVAQHLAADRPELVRAMILSATTSRPDAGVRAVLARWDAHLRAGRFTDFARDAIDRSFTGDVHAARRALLELVAPEPAPAALVARHLALSAACAAHDARARLSHIPQPVLVLAAAHDRVVPVTHSRELAACLGAGRFAMFAGLGHGFPEQAPERYRARVAGFLAEVLGPSVG